MQTLLPWLADILAILGLTVMSIAVYGLIWLPDIYLRLHAASKAVALGLIPVLLAVSLSGEPAIIGRVILIIVFLLLTTPVSAHALGYAAYLEEEPMRTPDVVDESGRLIDETQAEREG